MSNIASTIAIAVEQQGSATQEIARSVQTVAQGAEEAASSVSQVNRGATETGVAFRRQGAFCPLASNKCKFVAYYRVSTDRRGKSGLGLEAQRKAVENYLNGGPDRRRIQGRRVGQILRQPAGSGSCLHGLPSHRATLIIAKLDRLSRDAHFLLWLQKVKVDFICCDDPHMTPLTLGIRAVVAQHERELISTRTKDALAAARRKVKKLGGRRYKLERDAKGEVVKDGKGKPIYSRVLAKGSAKARAADTRALQERAAMRAADIAPAIKILQEAGATTLRAIADGLNARGIPTARGPGDWSPTQVRRALERLQ
ncbi:recombinase family protein (plasmid) [Bradyrhizobium sp. CB82]|uniref:recombinase family protein n=1 Tax=Bradyrhizobium sp. CB82 TaxID=3039159 RepID=UPI0024B074E1|nr:recombinase family protein [Bradyrhizobium sp. CB82]WFU45810.1 recombinase family protein [Bradyrhizobium sp. CB82]